MIRSRLGFKAFGLCVLVLGLMAFVTGVARAETGAKWLVSGADVGSLAPQLTISEIEAKSTSLSFTTAGNTNVLILCTGAAIVEGGKLIAGGGISLGRVNFTGCKVLLNHVLATKCEAHSPGKPNGEILTERGKGLITLDVGNDLVLITPEDASGATTKLLAVIELGEFCAIGEEIKVECHNLGDGFWIADGGGNAGALNRNVSSHLIIQGLSTLLALGQPANILGSAVIGLSGVHAGLSWSGDWS